MKNIIILGLTLISILGCKKNSHTIKPVNNPEPSTIEGLELTFINPGESYNLRAIHFVDNFTGFASGYDGSLIKTSDGGKTWTKLQTNTSVPLFGIDFADNNTGFVVGGDSGCQGIDCIPIGAVMLKTTDGGNTWQKITLNLTDQIELKSVHFINSSIGYAVGHSSILKTIDGGDTWEETIIDSLGSQMQDVDFNGLQNGIVCAGGKIISTTNGGNSWNINSTISLGGFSSATIAQDNISYISGSGGNNIFKSIDFSNSWIELTNSSTGNYDINFITQDIGFAVGRGYYSGGDFGHNYGAISYTTDKGENWIVNKNIIESSGFHGSSFPSNNLGYIVGSNTIVKVTIK